MKQTQKLSRIVIALMAISHDRIDYPTGSIFKVPEKDVVFLKMAKCVREPTADEIKAYEERQTLATVTATQPDDTDHAGLQPQPPSDSEPVAGMTAKTIDAPQHLPPATQTEVVEPETIEPQSNKSAYHGWLKSDLNAELDKRGIERDVTRNDELEALLIADDQAKSNA